MSHRTGRVTKGHVHTHTFKCRLCKKYHPLRLCSTFLKMPIDKRLRAVLLFKYCSNCLAHEHSGYTCISNTGCHVCSKKHHTLLHFNENQNKRSFHRSSKDHPRNSRPRDIRKINEHGQITHRRDGLTTSGPSVSSIMSRHVIALLPTTTVMVIHNSSRQSVRALINVCATHSTICRELVNMIRLTTYQLEDEIYTPLMITSKIDPQVRIAVDARILPHMKLKTPSSPLNSTIISQYSHLMLADGDFHTPKEISLVLGNDVYNKIVKTGVIPGHNGLPFAQDTVFGWVLSGACTQ